MSKSQNIFNFFFHLQFQAEEFDYNQRTLSLSCCFRNRALSLLLSLLTVQKVRAVMCLRALGKLKA